MSRRRNIFIYRNTKCVFTLSGIFILFSKIRH